MPVQYLLTYFIPAAAGTTKEEIQRATGTSGPEQMQWVTDQLLSNTAKKELKVNWGSFVCDVVDLKMIGGLNHSCVIKPYSAKLFTGLSKA